MSLSELTIRKVIEQITNGQIRIPAFQRGFVWDAERVAYLMDSIYKGYPFGALLLWRTREPLKVERNLGPYVLPPPQKDYPIDYVLDGQQRITSIFGVFQSDLPKAKPDEWTNIYFDLQAEDRFQDSQFVALKPEDADKARYFPLGVLFNSVEYRRATEELDPGLIERIDKLQDVFKEARLPIQTLETDERAKVAIVFERVNRLGVELDVFQLLSAWTWSEDFDLQSQFSQLADELSAFGFKNVGDDSTLLLRCCAAVVAEKATPEALVNLNGGDVRAKFTHVKNGIKGAIDFLRREFKVERLDNLPFATLLVPLSAFFAIDGERHVNLTADQLDTLKKWVWRTCFQRRYSSGVARMLQDDIIEILKLKRSEPNNLIGTLHPVTSDFFLNHYFRISSVDSKTFILLLASNSPKSWVSGAAIDLADVMRKSNRLEYHHIYPQAYLKTQGVSIENINCLANICMLAREDNQRLGGDAPSVYQTKMPANKTPILDSAYCDSALLFADVFDPFKTDRATKLADVANALQG